MKKHIYVCTPSAPFQYDKKFVKKAYDNLQALGFEITFSKHMFEDRGNTSSSIENRLQDLHEGFTNDKYDIVMASRGGWNSNELLPHIDYDLISKNKKPFFGMSDMTTLCVNLFQNAGIPTVYGQLFLHFGLTNDMSKFTGFVELTENMDSYRPTSFLHMLTEENIVKPGIMKGTLLGGNLAVLCWLIGTDYSLKVYDDTILFLEDDEETNGFYWQMYLNHMKQAGYFRKIKGIIFGKTLLETEFNKNSSFKEIIRLIFEEYDFPIYIEADFGHIDFPKPIVYGSKI